MLEVLVRHGEDVNAFGDETGMSALHAACRFRYQGLRGVVDLLLKHGADEDGRG